MKQKEKSTIQWLMIVGILHFQVNSMQYVLYGIISLDFHL